MQATNNRDTSTMVGENLNRARGLTDDVILEILSRLPLKSIARFSCVSKACHAVITSDDGYYRRKLPQAMAGLFYVGDFGKGGSELVSTWRREEGSKDAADLFSFLPPLQATQVIRSCNGMLLCRCWETDDDDNCLYVCNPATKRWVKIPKPEDPYHVLALAFDPRLSPHYKVVTVSAWEGGEDGRMDILSSETGQWVRSSGCNGGVDISFDVEQDFPVFFHGNIHLVRCSELAVVAIDLERKECRTMRLPAPVEDHAKRLMEESLLEFAGGLRCAMQTAYEMLVWYLEDYDQNEWILKYRISLGEILEKPLVKQLVPRQSYADVPMVALHPGMDAVFLNVDGTLVSWSLLGSNDVTKISVLKGTFQHHFYTYSPCYSEDFPTLGLSAKLEG